MASLIIILAMSGILASVPSMAANEAESCKRITAALARKDGYVLFFGNDFVVFDKDFKQVDAGDSTMDAFGAPWPDAAFMMARYTYYFSDKYYFLDFNNFVPVDAKWFGGQRLGYFFENGLDAAGNFKDATFFFKGDKFIFAGIHGPSNPIPIPDGIPSNLDAALTVGDEMWLFKYDKLWHMPVAGQKPDDPVETSSVFKFNDIKLCAEPPKKEE